MRFSTQSHPSRIHLTPHIHFDPLHENEGFYRCYCRLFSFFFFFVGKIVCANAMYERARIFIHIPYVYGGTYMYILCTNEKTILKVNWSLAKEIYKRLTHPTRLPKMKNPKRKKRKEKWNEKENIAVTVALVSVIFHSHRFAPFQVSSRFGITVVKKWK